MTSLPNGDLLKALIKIRKQYCVHSESRVFVDTAKENEGYAAYIQGDRGELAVKIGPFSWSPRGRNWHPTRDLLASGNDYAVWGEKGKLRARDCN